MKRKQAPPDPLEEIRKDLKETIKHLQDMIDRQKAAEMARTMEFSESATNETYLDDH